MDDICLTATEVRIIGCLLEKESTVPDQYPLTLNSLVNACNQKSSRDPVMTLSSSEVVQALKNLIENRIVKEENGARVSRYRHRFCNTPFSQLQLSDQERALICLLMLRGPQTPGELRGRCERLATFQDVNEVELSLQHMREQELVVLLPRAPGRREARYYHLFSGDVNPADMVVYEQPDAHDKANIQVLEQKVSDLQAEVERLRALIPVEQWDEYRESD